VSKNPPLSLLPRITEEGKNGQARENVARKKSNVRLTKKVENKTTVQQELLSVFSQSAFKKMY
jgi:hypothetical protein